MLGSRSKHTFSELHNWIRSPIVHNTSNPESTLKKKSNSIAYHLVRESVAMDESRTGYVNTLENLADLMTKPLPKGERRELLVSRLMWDIYSRAPDTV